MSLALKLANLANSGKPVRVGLIGAGKFGSMFLSQAPRTPGLHVLGIADRDVGRARQAIEKIGWPVERTDVKSFAQALKTGSTFLTDEAEALIVADEVEVIVEATGDPAAGARHALACFHTSATSSWSMSRPTRWLGRCWRAARPKPATSIPSSMATSLGLITELVDWVRTAGFEVVCAGKGTKYLPMYRTSMPATGWGHYGFSKAQVAAGDFSAKMFNSFLDRTKSAIEMAAVANACDLDVAADGLGFPACGVDDLPSLLRPRAEGGVLPRSGMVEVVSSL